MDKVYFDNSATTPVDKRVFKEMEPYFIEKFGNPSSIHGFGQEAISGVDEARQRVAEFLNSRTDEVIFTSGATESDNLVIKGLIQALQKQGEKKGGSKNCRDISSGQEKTQKGSWESGRKFHIITTSVEHKAVLQPCAELEAKGQAEVTYLPVQNNGTVDPEEVKNAIQDNTVLVSVMYVNSEIGSVNPIKEIGKVIKKVNENRYRDWQKWGAKKKLPQPQKIYFHTDATQALNFYGCDVQRLRLDFLSLSGHKIYGPKGVGALFVRQGSELKAIQTGGSQERNLRSGTLNSPGIVGLGKAVSLLTKDRQKKNNKRIAQLRDKLVQGVKDNISDVVLTTDRDNSTPAHAHFIFRGAEGESILMSLDLEGIAVSTGSACASKDLHPSHVLKAIGVAAEDANCAVRFSLGKKNTEEDIDRVLEVLPSIIEKIRRMNPVYDSQQ